MYKNIGGVIWSSFWSFPVWVLCLVLKAMGQVALVDMQDDLILVWYFREDRWFYKKMFKERNWNGFGWGNNILVGASVYQVGGKVDRTLKHEAAHCHQQYRWGFLFPFAYLGHSIYIFIFFSEKHSYYDNCFERDARQYAGQQVDIPKGQWAQGPSDRWAWW